MSFSDEAAKRTIENGMRMGLGMPAQLGPIYQGATDAVTERPLFVRLVDAAEGIAGMTGNVEARLEQLIARAIGPTPSADQAQTGQSPASGHLGALDIRLTSTAASLQRISILLDRIERVI